MNSNYNFSSKTVVITGASRGIGRAIAQAFLASGAKVVNLSRTALPKKTTPHPNLIFAQLDVTDLKKTKAWITKFTQKNKIDIWVNNAGIYPQGELMETTESDWDKTFSTNLKSLFFISQSVAKHMQSKKGGVIVNAASFAAAMPSIGSGIYATSKAAVISLTKSMAAEWAADGIRVVSYSPGLIATDMTAQIIAQKKTAISKPIALARHGQPEEVAAPILFLCSPDAEYITGINLDISGGKFLVQNQADA